MATITHKAGDTFKRSLAVDVSGLTAGMQVKAVFVRGAAKIEISNTLVDNGGDLTSELTASAATTSAWLTGLYKGDISFGTQQTTVDSTETIEMLVERSY